MPPDSSTEVAAGRRKTPWSRQLLALTLLLALVLLCVAIAGVGAAMRPATDGDTFHDSDHPAVTAAPDGRDANHSSATLMTRYSVVIRQPAGPPRVATGLVDAHGTEVTVACSTCHTTRPPNHQNKSAGDLDEFHGGLKFSHGTVSCLSCHNELGYDALKLADDSRVEFSEVMTLCAQCHGPQMKAYQHGAHGGMNGYWDLSRGPREKNNCVDCHDPHSPQFPKMRPTFKPRDRFLEPQRMEH